MDVRLPNGTIIRNVPDGMSKAELSAKLLANGYDLSGPAEPTAPKPIPERTYGEAAKDVGGKFVSGIGSLVQLPGQLYGLATGDFSKTGLLGAGEDIREYGESMLSPSLKAKEEARAQKVAEAEKTGQLAAAGTAFSETVTDPALLVGFLVEQVPQLIPALLTGGGTAALTASGIAAKEAAALVASGAAKEAAELAAKQIAAKKAGELGVKAAVGTGAVQQGADVGAGAYENIYKAAIDKGMPEAEAAKTALNAARAAGASGAIISLLAQRLPGARTLEEAFSGVPGTTGRLLGAGKGALGESAGEIVEEGGGKFSQNLAMREVNPEQSLTEGLGQAAGMAAIGGGAMGAIAGGARRPAEEPSDTAGIQSTGNPPTNSPIVNSTKVTINGKESIKVTRKDGSVDIDGIQVTPPTMETLPPEPPPPPMDVPPPMDGSVTSPVTPPDVTAKKPKAPEPPPEAKKVEFKPADLEALTNYTEGLPDDAANIFQRMQNRDRASDASIGQMQDVRTKPDYDRLKSSPDFGSGAPVVISDIKISENQMGRQDIATATNGQKIPVQYAVIDANDLLTSHTVSGQQNPEYGNVTTPAIRAVAGNGRIAGLQASYTDNFADNYRNQMLQDNQHGIEPSVIEGIQNPVLVRIMPKSYITPDIGDISNTPGQLRLSPVEEAKNDVNRIDLNALDFNEDGTINTKTVMQFVQGMPETEWGELMGKNKMPTSRAVDRLNNAIFYKAYGSDSLIDLYAQAADPEAKLILAALAKAAGNVSKLEGAGQYDIRPNIIEAAELAVNARRDGIKLQDFVKQGQLGLDPNTLAVLEMFAENGRSGKRMGEILNNFADAAYKANEQSGTDMFGDTVEVPLSDVFKALKAEGAPDLFTEPTAPKELPEPKDFVAKKSMEEIAKEIKGMTATQLAQWAVDNAPNSAAKAIAEKVLVRIKELDERGFFRKPVEVLNRSDLKYRGRFTYALDFSYGELKFAGLKNGKAHRNTGTRYITILHELLHAVTVPALSTSGKEYNDLTVVLNKVKKQIAADQKAGKTRPIFGRIAGGANTIQNVKELISWGLTDPEFQDYLSTVKVGDTNALTRMVEIFRKFLGLDAKYETALDAVVRATDTILDTPTELIEKGIGRSIGVKKAAPIKPAAKATTRKKSTLEQKENYVTADEIFKMQREAYDEFRNTEEFKKSQKRIEDAQKEFNDRFQAVVNEAVRLLREQPRFKDVLDDLPESSIYNIAMTAFREVAEKNIPMPKTSEHDAIVAHNKLIENFFKSKKIPEPRAFSEQANQDRPYYSSPSFKKWFGNSKAVNKSGKPLVAFHTTDKNFNIFNVGEGVKDKGINPNYTGKLGSWFTAPSLYDAGYEVGNAENAVSFSEGKEGDNTMIVHLSIQNPMEYEGFEDLQEDRDSYSSVEKFKKSLIEKGYDGVVVRNSMTDGNVDRDDWVAFYPTQIKSAIGNNGNFSLEKEAIEEENIGDKLKAKITTKLQTRPPLNPEDFQGVPQEFLDRANPVYAPQHKTIIQRLEEMKDKFWQRLAQGIADQFRTIKEYSEDAYMLARMSKTVDGALEGLMFFGQVFNDGGALNIKSGTKGLIDILKPLGNEVSRYQMWIALNREADLPPEKRTIFIDKKTGEDVMPYLVKNRNTLIDGDLDGKPRKQLYESVRTEMNKLNRSVLKVALDAGLIDSTANAIDRLNARIQGVLNNEKMSDAKKEDEIADLEAQIEELNQNPIGYERFVADINYIPFYREMEDGDVSKVMTATGLSNQHFSKALEGGTSPFADLMENTLRNWSHILSASMKNQAAAATLTAAEGMGGAEPNLKVPYYMIDGKVHTRANDEMVGDGSVKSWMTTTGTGTVKAMVEGQPVHYNVLDPLLLDSIASIGYMGPKSKFLDVARDFKNILQFGVTISPAFKVNNLIRDSVQAMAVSDLKKNPFANVVNGWILSDQNNPAHMSALAGGALFNFGSIVEGDQAALIKRLVKMGVKEEHILDTPAKIKTQLKKAWDKYQEFGNKSEAANRMALYQQLKDKGYNHLEASFYARDLLDFSMQGSWPAFRLLTQVVPFLNARVQGLYKLGRDGINPTSRVVYNSITGKPLWETDKAGNLTEKGKRDKLTDQQKANSFSVVTGAVCLASLALYFAFKDDEEYKKRDDWDRDNFWWFKLPGMDYALRIPKPFEIGAFGTIAERTAEQIFDQGAEGKQFEKSLKNMITNTFAVNLPQFVKPLVDLYANKDSFSGAPIESAGMERLSKQERATDTTSPLAIALGGLSSVALPGEGMSPVQMDYAIKAYFGWLGATIAQTSHYAVMPFKSGAYPDTKWIDKVSVGLVKSLPANQSKYATAFYESNKEISQAYADMRHYAEIGDSEKVLKILEEKKDKIQLNQFYDKTAKNMAKVRLQIRVIMNDTTMSGAAKREEIDRLKEIISMLAKQAEEARKSMKK
jgi:hypothetical protein